MRRLAIAVAFTTCVGCGSTELSGDASSDTITDDATDAVGDTAGDPDLDDTSDAVTDPGMDCPPVGDGVWLDWTFDGAGWDEGMDIDTPCLVEAVTGEDVGHVIIDLSCGTGAIMTPHQIEIFSNPHTWLEGWEGADVMLRYVSRPWFEGVDRWFTLRIAGGDLFAAGVSATGLAPPGESLDEWYAPLAVSMVSGVCPVEPDVCGPTERLGVEVTFGGDTDVIFDSQAANVGGVVTASVIVETAYHVTSMECADFPGDWVDALFVVLPEG